MKGGISETRIEKRIVITGDTEIDHDKVRNVNVGRLSDTQNFFHASVFTINDVIMLFSAKLYSNQVV